MSVEMLPFGQAADGREVKKIVLRQGKLTAELMTLGGAVLAVSQFTLCADVRHGRRPDFLGAARPETARPLFDEKPRCHCSLVLLTFLTQRHHSNCVECVSRFPPTEILSREARRPLVIKLRRAINRRTPKRKPRFLSNIILSEPQHFQIRTPHH